LNDLPKRRRADFEEKVVTVSSSGGFVLRRVDGERRQIDEDVGH